MIGTIAAVAGKAVISMIMRLATKEFIEEVLLWIAEKAVAHTDSKADDQLLAKIKEHLDG